MAIYYYFDHHLAFCFENHFHIATSPRLISRVLKLKENEREFLEALFHHFCCCFDLCQYPWLGNAVNYLQLLSGDLCEGGVPRTLDSSRLQWVLAHQFKQVEGKVPLEVVIQEPFHLLLVPSLARAPRVYELRVLHSSPQDTGNSQIHFYALQRPLHRLPPTVCLTGE